MYKTERNSIKRFAILKILNQTKNSNLLEWSTIVAEAVNGPKMPSKSQCRFSPRPVRWTRKKPQRSRKSVTSRLLMTALNEFIIK
ncbi:uncharacterized protein LOC119769446 isoform X2 [Culex quinquefasciatus]|uniref:uncharacterized protein LOC119765412 isoform X2 n=1 Tax=Culex quinquefasciatus TaxID=7176 RepID=UPI0018E3F337|nr:uncharacterized protein LOC119765412 isoform X2 [Culex quinquefasciatus]XP_038117829.1 uncharacterized protein LOC119769446 isoform X2 [Culex quinquefasciatus]